MKYVECGSASIRDVVADTFQRKETLECRMLGDIDTGVLEEFGVTSKLPRSVSCREDIPPLPGTMAEVEGGVYLRGGFWSCRDTDPKITVSALEIGIKAIQIGKIFACGAQI